MSLLERAVSLLEQGDVAAARRAASDAAITAVDALSTDPLVLHAANRLNRALGEVIAVVAVVRHVPPDDRQLVLVWSR